MKSVLLLACGEDSWNA